MSIVDNKSPLPATSHAPADEGLDPRLGARPLWRVIQQRIENALAARILSGEFAPGDRIDVDYLREQFAFAKKAAEAGAAAGRS